MICPRRKEVVGELQTCTGFWICSFEIQESPLPPLHLVRGDTPKETPEIIALDFT